jgi:deazaflavin-dependent oxidoreductase (nitroreductase family)
MTFRLAASAFRQVNRFVEPVIRVGAASLIPLGPALVVLETVGRRTRRARTVPVLALRFGSKVFVGTVRGNSSWLANVENAPGVAVWMGGSRRTGRATVRHEGLIDVASIEVESSGESG